MGGEELLGQHLVRAAVGDERAGPEQEDAVGVLRGERQVVHRRHEGQPLLAPQVVEQVEGLLLVADVEGGRRLVEHDDPRLLGERARDHGPLPLTAAQCPEPPVGKPAEVEPLERPGRGLEVAPSLGLEEPEVRRPAEQDVLADRQPVGRRGLLRHDGDLPGYARVASASSAACPSIAIVPSYRTSPAIARRRVVFPAPFAPITATHSPSAIDAVTSPRTRAPPREAPTPVEGNRAHRDAARPEDEGEERRAEERRHDPDRQLRRRERRAGDHVREDEEAGPGDERQRQQHPVARTGQHPDRVRAR